MAKSKPLTADQAHARTRELIASAVRTLEAEAGGISALMAAIHDGLGASFTAAVDLPTSGYYEMWAKATDSKGVSQPFTAANWNPQGYGANPINRIRVLVDS